MVNRSILLAKALFISSMKAGSFVVPVKYTDLLTELPSMNPPILAVPAISNSTVDEGASVATSELIWQDIMRCPEY